jgi:hypothetical protein
MSRRLPAPLVLLATLLLVWTLRAGDEPKPDPEKPDAPPAKDKAKASDDLPGPFRPFNISGRGVERVNQEIRKFRKQDEKDKSREPDRGTFHCLVSEHGLNPVVMVLVRGTDPSPALLDLLKKLDAAVEKNQNARLASFVVFLTEKMVDGKIIDLVEMDDEREEEVAQVEARTKNAELKNLAVALDVYPTIKELFKLRDDAEVTVIIYNKLKVLSTLAFPKDELNEAGVQKVLDTLNTQLAAIRAEGAGKGLPAR